MSAPVADFAASGIRWDLSSLFSGIDDPKIEENWKKSSELADQFAEKYRGRVVDLSAEELATAIIELEHLVNFSQKPGSFASLLYAGDTSNPKHGAFYQKAQEKGSELRIKIMFFSLEVQKIDAEKFAAHLSHPSLANYVHYLQDLRKYLPHLLDESSEILLEETANIGNRAWERLHDEVTSNHVYNWTNPETGEAEELTEGEVLQKMREPNREVRKAASEAFTAGLRQIERVIAFTYNTLLADKKLDDRLRGYTHAEDSRHMANELDKETVDLVMDLCKQRSDLVARYYRVKKEILGLDELTEYDRYAPLKEAGEKFSYDQAKNMILDAFQEFHPELKVRAKEFFDKNWIDAEPRKGKTGGAFCSYITPDLHPVILMTYLGSLDNVSTLAHELGHGVHSSLSREQTQFNYHGTLPLAELASIFAEMVIFEKLTAKVNDEDKLSLYADKLEGIYASVHRQSAMFRFEKRCHEHRRTQGELAPEDFQNYWQEEIQSMFQDSVKLGDQHKLWWMYVGHFFFAPFYVYAYSFGELLTLSIYQLAKQKGPSFADQYIEVLKLGGSKTPHELMGLLGVDLRSKEFWEGGFNAIEDLVKTTEELWAKVKS